VHVSRRTLSLIPRASCPVFLFIVYLLLYSVFLFHCFADHRDLHSFLHDALPISRPLTRSPARPSRTSSLLRLRRSPATPPSPPRSEEHTSELQSRFDLVCRLLLEKKKITDSDTY